MVAMTAAAAPAAAAGRIWGAFHASHRPAAAGDDRGQILTSLSSNLRGG